MIDDDWTKIKPHDLEALGWIDQYDEEQGGPLGYLDYTDLPPNVEILTANYLATHWEIFACTEANGDEYFNVVTPEDYNEVMEYIGVDCLMEIICE